MLSHGSPFAPTQAPLCKAHQIEESYQGKPIQVLQSSNSVGALFIGMLGLDISCQMRLQSLGKATFPNLTIYCKKLNSTFNQHNTHIFDKKP